MLAQIHQFIKEHKLIPENRIVVLGLSGGPDSIFLLHVLADMHKQQQISLIAAHLDHEWRTNSAEDALFCKQTAEALGIPYVQAKASELGFTIKKNGSQEEYGRKLRRAFLESVAHQHGAQAIALAHHAQDQEETFFIRLIRGTTLSGIIGMKPKNGLYIRPLLETNKQDMLDYLHSNKIAYVIDPTNVDESYLRNRIRAQALPALHNADNRFDANFLRTIKSLQQAEQFLETITHESFNACTELRNGSYWLALPKIVELHPYMLKRVVMHWLILNQVPFYPTESFLDEIIRFFNATQSNEHTIHETWKIVKKDNIVGIVKK